MENKIIPVDKIILFYKTEETTSQPDIVLDFIDQYGKVTQITESIPLQTFFKSYYITGNFKDYIAVTVTIEDTIQLSNIQFLLSNGKRL